MAISVFLADDNLIVREGVKALLDLEDDLEIVGQAADYDELIAGAEETQPQVIVTDIRMPPDFSREGIEGAREIRKRHPGTGVVILSQFDDPDYAVSLLAEGAAGYAYLLKDKVGEGNQLIRAVREVAAGGSVLDSSIVEGLINPVREDAGLSTGQENLLQQVAEGRTIKAIAAQRKTTPADVDAAIEALFMTLAEGLAAGRHDSLQRLRMLQKAIVDRKEQGESLSRLLPGGIASQILDEGRRPGETEELVVTVLMSDIRGYTTIAEHADPSTLAGQLNEHRAAMNHAIIENSGTVMQFVGDAVMAVFGAPVPQANHAGRAVDAARAMHAAQQDLNGIWEVVGHAPFGLGIGLSTGLVAAALLGSQDRLEYSVVGDTVNLTQRLQEWAQPGETVVSEPTWLALNHRPDAEALEPSLVKGRDALVSAFRFPRRPS
ncbi:MAG: adenylate/guanylate cyclase domain-containing protein [Actinomycetota bacterium]|nr:adenylate/guanylate cyclase domain-containing protein [Actinomycetota bacterium]